MLIGIDIGTTGTKTILTDAEGGVVASSYRGYELISPRQRFVEQDPLAWWSAVCATVSECAARVPAGERVTALSLSVQSGTMIPLDENGNPLAPAVSWLDTRGDEQCRRLIAEYGEAYFYRKTGWKLSDCFNFIQICWMRDNDPALFSRTRRFASVADYMTFLLTGVYATDRNSANNLQLYNLTEKVWDKDILSLAGIDESRVSPLADSGVVVGTLTKAAAEALSLSEGTPVVGGGQDQYCSALSIGAIHPGDIMFSTGTSWVVAGISDRCIFDDARFLTIANHMVSGLYASYAYTPAGGAALRWYRDQMGGRPGESYDDITARAAGIAPGAEGLFFLPHLGGTLYPAWSMESRGTLFGLDLMHTSDHVARAVMEGVAFDLMMMLESIRQTGYDLRVLKALGGSTRSEVWMQIVSDVTGLEMQISDYANMAPLGAAMNAAVGTGLYPDYETAFRAFRKPVRCIRPDAGRHARYRELYEAYLTVFHAQERLYQRMSQR